MDGLFEWPDEWAADITAISTWDQSGPKGTTPSTIYTRYADGRVTVEAVGSPSAIGPGEEAEDGVMERLISSRRAGDN